GGTGIGAVSNHWATSRSLTSERESRDGVTRAFIAIHDADRGRSLHDLPARGIVRFRPADCLRQSREPPPGARDFAWTRVLGPGRARCFALASRDPNRGRVPAPDRCGGGRGHLRFDVGDRLAGPAVWQSYQPDEFFARRAR